MPIFDYKCGCCGFETEAYVSNRDAAVECTNCVKHGCDSTWRQMNRIDFSSTSRSTFDVRGYNAHNRYGLDWANNNSDRKLRGFV